MAAPKGNRFWEFASTYGRKQIFSDPTTMRKAITAYFGSSEDNPLMEHDFVGKDAIEVEKRKMRAFTLSGLCIYLGVNTKYFYDFEDRLKDKDDPESKEFSEIISWARDVIFTRNFEGASAGLLNANIISRQLGLADKQDLNHTNNGESFKQLIITPASQRPKDVDEEEGEE